MSQFPLRIAGAPIRMPPHLMCLMPRKRQSDGCSAARPMPILPPMPRQNRVTPLSTLIADPARGLFMGNRGCLHNADGQIVRPCRGRLWITCLTDFKGRQRALLQPGSYTELFFLDEAVALSAGHRPCAECRRAAYRCFRTAWAAANLPACSHAQDMDRYLHTARRTGRQQRHHTAQAESLPDGAFALGPEGQPLLIAGRYALPYAPAGYGPPVPRPQGPVTVLTPAPIVAVLAAGYPVVLHPSARGSIAPSTSQPDAPPCTRRAFWTAEAP